MNYYLIIRPLIGAGIGYITNWIAVKMLFRPLNPIKLGRFTLPFTPGIIPKNKERLAISIGDAISNNLLTEDTLKGTLLSDEKKEEIRTLIKSNIEQNDNNIQDILLKIITTDDLSNIENSINKNLTNSIFNSLKEANLGQTFSEQIILAASEKMKGSILGMLGGKSVISSFGPEISSKINEYIDNNGEIIISSIIEEEINKLESKHISDMFNDSNLDYTAIIMQLYEKIILEKLPNLLNAINISKIVSEKINSMPTLELEKLILEIMKKELSALVNLGAVIGFILGLLNLLF